MKPSLLSPTEPFQSVSSNGDVLWVSAENPDSLYK